jgi:hypothetical protein
MVDIFSKAKRSEVLSRIIAARGVTHLSNFPSGLLEADAIAPHGDERYQPCGWLRRSRLEEMKRHLTP